LLRRNAIAPVIFFLIDHELAPGMVVDRAPRSAVWN